MMQLVKSYILWKSSRIMQNEWIRAMMENLFS